MAKSNAILRPNLGLVLDQAAIAVPDGALQAGHNFRVREGKLSNLNLGWDRFGSFQLNGPVTLISNYFNRASTQQLLFGTPKDLYRYVDDSTVVYLTPRYETGTISVTNGSATVTGVGTNWTLSGLKAGDEISVGATGATDPTLVWHEILSVNSNTSLTLAAPYTGVTAAGQAYTGRVRFTGTIDTPWEAVTFLHEGVADQDLWIATNGIDDIVVWNGSDTQTANAGIPFHAFHLAIYKNQLIATAITEAGEFFPAQMRNSRPGFPLDFVEGLASAFTVHEGSDEVSAAIPLGDSLVLYSQRHIQVADFVGDPFVYVIRTAVPNLGPLTGRLVADYGDYHTFVGPDGQYAFDGASVREIGQQVWRVVLRQRDPSREGRAFSFFDEENGELVWALPLNSDAGSDGPEIAYSDAYLENVAEKGLKAPISRRDLPFTTVGYFQRQSTLTWDQISQQWQELNFRWNDIFFEAAFPFVLAGDAAGRIFTLNTNQLAGGAQLPSFVRFGRRPTADGRMRGLLSRIYPFVTQFLTGALLVRTRMADSAQGPVTLIDEQTFDQTLPEGGHFVSPFRVGRFYELEFGTPGNAWELAGYDLDLRPGGNR